MTLMHAQIEHKIEHTKTNYPPPNVAKSSTEEEAAFRPLATEDLFLRNVAYRSGTFQVLCQNMHCNGPISTLWHDPVTSAKCRQGEVDQEDTPVRSPGIVVALYSRANKPHGFQCVGNPHELLRCCCLYTLDPSSPSF